MKTDKQSFLKMSMWVILLIGLGACRIDVSHEIWLNKDDSGKARIEMSMILPAMDELGSIDELLAKDNPFDSLATIVRNTEGAELISIDSKASETADEVTFNYFMEFTFNNPQTLQKIICTDPDRGVKFSKQGKKKSLALDLRQLSLQASIGSQDYIDLLSMNMVFKLNLPSAAKEINPMENNKKKQKNLLWQYPMDQDWFDLDAYEISVKY
ncbi:hypothetical protein MASR2M64_15600 [Candidatus Cloacimonadota bacterium]|jgi:hypothetical protein